MGEKRKWVFRVLGENPGMTFERRGEGHIDKAGEEEEEEQEEEVGKPRSSALLGYIALL